MAHARSQILIKKKLNKRSFQIRGSILFEIWLKYIFCCKFPPLLDPTSLKYPPPPPTLLPWSWIPLPPPSPPPWRASSPPPRKRPPPRPWDMSARKWKAARQWGRWGKQRRHPGLEVWIFEAIFKVVKQLTNAVKIFLLKCFMLNYNNFQDSNSAWHILPLPRIRRRCKRSAKTDLACHRHEHVFASRTNREAAGEGQSQVKEPGYINIYLKHNYSILLQLKVEGPDCEPLGHAPSLCRHERIQVCGGRYRRGQTSCKGMQKAFRTNKKNHIFGAITLQKLGFRPRFKMVLSFEALSQEVRRKYWNNFAHHKKY